MYLVIPMAGQGKRFREEGYDLPKPLIDVNGKTMIERVVRNLGLSESKHIFIVQKQHNQDYDLRNKILEFAPKDSLVVEVPGLLSGALLSVLAASDILVDDDELVIANSDQLISWNSKEFFREMEGADGGFMVFPASGNKWSYALVDDEGNVSKVEEKNQISTNATIGVYYWKSSNNFLTCAEESIREGITYNGEFYVAPVYNQAIKAGQKIVAVPSPRHISLGTPEQLREYLKQSRI